MTLQWIDTKRPRPVQVTVTFDKSGDEQSLLEIARKEFEDVVVTEDSDGK